MSSAENTGRSPRSQKIAELYDTLRARFPLVYVVSPEERVVLNHLVNWAPRIGGQVRRVCAWSYTRGFEFLGDDEAEQTTRGSLPEPVSFNHPETGERPQRVRWPVRCPDLAMEYANADQLRDALENVASVRVVDSASSEMVARPGPDFRDPVAALMQVARTQRREGIIFVMKDLHHHMEGARVVRALRDVAAAFSGSLNTLIVLAPVRFIPADLEQTFAVREFPLPGSAELERLLRETVGSLRREGEEDRFPKESPLYALGATAAAGLTLDEAENVFAKALVVENALTERLIELIHREKSGVANGIPGLKVIEPGGGFEAVGGFEYVKDYVRTRAPALFDREAREFGLPSPRGFMVAGLYGTGKSLVLEATARALHLPFVQLDFGALMDKWVGESDKNLARALKIVDAMAPCVLGVDEIEKVFSTDDPGGDSKVTERLLGQFLGWLQKHDSPVLVGYTANDHLRLPPALVRAGRIDVIFFCDLPEFEQRKQIFAIHLRAHKREPEAFDLDLLARESDQFVGSEIEQVVNDALFEVYPEHRSNPERDLETDDLLLAVHSRVPLAKAMEEHIRTMRHSVDGRRVRYASVREQDGIAGEAMRLARQTQQ